MYNKRNTMQRGTRMPDHYETLASYRRLHRAIGPSEIAKTKDVFNRILDEMKDEPTTSTMFEPYARIVNFLLANRMIKQQLSETADYDESPRDSTRAESVIHALKILRNDPEFLADAWNQDLFVAIARAGGVQGSSKEILNAE